MDRNGHTIQTFGNAGGSIVTSGKGGQPPAQVISAMKRRAQTGGGVNRLGQAPFNPFIQNLDIPTNYYVRNTYKRHFFKTNPIVGNAIEIHSEFALSDFHLEHPDPAIEEFLNDMLFEANFFEMLLMGNMERWLIGEMNWFSFFDDTENPSCYTGFALLDPNKLDVASNNFVQGHQKEVVQLMFDPVFKKIVANGSRDPLTGTLYDHLPSDMVEYCKADRPMPLSPLQVHRMKRGGYFNIRGDSILERIFPLLLYKDKLRTLQIALADRQISPIELYKIGETNDPADQGEIEAFREILQSTFYDINKCFHPSHECMTSKGWKQYTELTLEDKIGTINKDTGELEFQLPEAVHCFDFEGDLLHFEKNNVLVTPEHRMLVQQANWEKKSNNLHKGRFTNNWKFIEAKELLFGKVDYQGNLPYRFRGVCDSWKGETPPESIEIGETRVPLENYLEFAGYFIAEGSTGNYFNKDPKRYKQAGGFWEPTTNVSQQNTSKHIDHFNNVCDRFSQYIKLGKSTSSDGMISRGSRRKDFHEHFKENFGENCKVKKIPTWILNLPRELLWLFLKPGLNGDGTSYHNGRSFTYYSSSKQLSDQVQELVFRLGCTSKQIKVPAGYKTVFPDGKAGVTKSDSFRIHFTLNEKRLDPKDDWYLYPHVKKPKMFPYKGKVWCVTVSNGTVVTRRNGKITAQGNCIVWHHAIQAELVGGNSRMPNLWSEFDSADNEICAGLLINKGLILGDSSTFASDVVRLDILINRYLMDRTKIEQWMLRDLLAPILKIHEMYVPESKVKSMRYREMCGKGRPLSYPKIRWDKQSLRDENSKLQLMTQLVEKKLVPESTLIRMLNIDPKTAQEKVEEEAMAKIERHVALKKRLIDKGIPFSPEIAQILGFEGSDEKPQQSQMGGMPASIDSGGDPMSSMPQTNLPEVVPGATEDNQTGGIPKADGIQGAPSESQMPIGLPS